MININESHSTKFHIILISNWRKIWFLPSKNKQESLKDFLLQRNPFTLAVDKNQLGLAANVNVPQILDHHLTFLEGYKVNTMLGPFTADESNIHTISTWYSMFIPYELLEVLMGQDFSAPMVYPFLDDADLRDVCRSLQLTSTQPMDGNPRPYTLQDHLDRADYPVWPAVVSHHCESVLCWLLIALCPANLGRLPDSFIENLSDGLTNTSTKIHADHRAKEKHA
jgi:hypothetical protein